MCFKVYFQGLRSQLVNQFNLLDFIKGCLENYCYELYIYKRYIFILIWFYKDIVYIFNIY